MNRPLLYFLFHSCSDEFRFYSTLHSFARLFFFFSSGCSLFASHLMNCKFPLDQTGQDAVLLFDDYLFTQMTLTGTKPKLRKLHLSGASPASQNASLYFELDIPIQSSAYCFFMLTDIFTVQLSVCSPFPLLTVILLGSCCFFFFLLSDFFDQVASLTCVFCLSLIRHRIVIFNEVLLASPFVSEIYIRSLTYCIS